MGSAGSRGFINPDKYTTIKDVQDALRREGIEESNIVFGIDYTKSNETSGKYTFNGDSLHSIRQGRLNPYQQVIKYIGETMEAFDEDHLIPAFGFGCLNTKDTRIFNLKSSGSCFKFTEVLEMYNQIAPQITLSGPTSFVPIIRHAIEIVKHVGTYHILVIITDGQVTDPAETGRAIAEASQYPLSIVCVGVGDGPFDSMKVFDDGKYGRKFDNLQFVSFDKVVKTAEKRGATVETQFAVDALQEIPDQYNWLKRRGKYLTLPQSRQTEAISERLVYKYDFQNELANAVTDRQYAPAYSMQSSYPSAPPYVQTVYPPGVQVQYKNPYETTY